MKFLLVLGEDDVMWLEDAMKALKAEVVIKNTPEEAADFIRSENFSRHKIITGTFSEGDLNGPWRQVWEAAKERGMGITLFTGQIYSEDEIASLAQEGVTYLGKLDFKQEEFIAEHSGATKNHELE